MILSVIIVNYNVRYFLDQCLESVFHSDTTGFDLEVFVVDNASQDTSVAMVRERYPQVHLIANTDNPGFATANNQALRICHGDLMLLLNPDTVVERDTFRKCVEFYAATPDCGGLTVKMINGEGRYLKESKRGFPTPAASFYKMSGLIHLFPHHPRIAAYYMGHLSDDETNAIDILPGAYLMISRPAYERVGGLDETYFMFGEDIDFSWRIKLAGYQNYYLPSARIIHYKGECSKHGSMNYVYTFYNAMSIFVKHYFTGSGARFFTLLLRLAIWGRATLAWLQRIVKAIALPVADFAAAFAGFLVLKHLWAAGWAANINYYPPMYTFVVLPLYILILMLASWLYGGYDKPVRLSRIIRGMAVGCGVLLVFYSLLNESQRYSRMLLLLGSLWTLLSNISIRAILSLLHLPGYDLRPRRIRTCLIVGSDSETQRVSRLYASLGAVNTVALAGDIPDSRTLDDSIYFHHADEVVFCGKDIATQQIIDLMTQLAHGRNSQVEYKIVPPESDFIIGSNSISSAEDIYSEDLLGIATPLNRRNKRLLDILSSTLLLLLSPLLFWFQHHKGTFFPHCWQVLTGRRSWVGTDDGSTRPGIFAPEDALTARATGLSNEVRQRIRLRYLRNYRPTDDLHILTKNIFKI